MAGRSYAVLASGDDLIGFFEFKPTTEPDAIEVGLGMRPDLTGQGRGLAFLSTGLDFARAHLRPQRIILKVARFNERAITVNERAGFVWGEPYLQWTNGAWHPFIRMERPV